MRELASYNKQLANHPVILTAVLRHHVTSPPPVPPIEFRKLLTAFNTKLKASATSDLSAIDAPTATPWQVELIIERLSAAVCDAESVTAPLLCGFKAAALVETSHYGGITYLKYGLFGTICIGESLVPRPLPLSGIDRFPSGRTPGTAFDPLRGNRI